MNVAEVVGDRFDADATTGQSLRKEKDLSGPSDVPIAEHAPHLERAVVCDGRWRRGIGPWRGSVMVSRTVLADAFVRSLTVVHRSKVIEHDLLLPEARCSTSGKTLLQSLMHSLVTAVLLGAARHDEHRLDVELHEANAEGGEP